MSKDWKGNTKTTFATLGASNHSDTEREANDFYASDPQCAIDLLNVLPELDQIWECSCGQGHLAKEFDKVGKLARASDLIDRNYGEIQDFLNTGVFEANKATKPFLDIVTNPPYSLAEAFLLQAMGLLQENRYYCALLKITWLEGKARRKIFEQYPPKFVYVYSQRINCAKNGEFNKYKATAICYCWYIWQKGFKGDTVVRWI
jgi:hypothetical protein